jgi:DNA-binding transcriptional LysR family regulator
LILQQGRDLEDEIERLRGLNTGRLEITLGPYAAETTGHRSIARLVAQHEHIRCRIRVSDWRQAMKDVLDGRSEMALTDASEVESKPDLQASPVFSHPMYFFCRSGHEILRLDTPQLSDLAAYPWAATRAPARIADFAPREMGRAGSWEESTGDFVPAIALEVAHDIASIAVASDVIAVAPITMIEQELRAGTLVLIPIAAPWLRLEYALLARANRTRSAVALAFAKLLSQVEDELQQQEAALQARYAIS